jgi:Ca-activated chloride channel family protein
MSAGQRDYYALLGVLRDASTEDIKRAYHGAARRFHPDKNVLPGETELFLEVQRAYEVLSNPQRRAQYDATLPPEEQLAGPVECTVQYSRPMLVHLKEPQLLYAMLQASAAEQAGSIPMTPLNLCLVLDRSTSMQGEKMDLVKAGASRILTMLRPEDLFSVVVFGDRAEVLLASSFQHDLKKAQSRIQSIQPGGATEIFRGLEAAMGELHRGLDPNRGNHLILLTDGHTYGDEQACLQLAAEAAKSNISISGFGVGTDWNDIFLDSLASRTGGTSTFISDPAEIEQILIEKFKALARTFVDDAVLRASPPKGVEVRYAFRVQPEGGTIEIGEEMHLGPILQDMALHVLFEFVIGPGASKADEVTLIDGTLNAVVRARPTPFPPIRLRLSRPAAESASDAPPPQVIVNALAKLSLYRLQERAREEAAAGEYESATRHLKNLSVQLEAQGHHDLSKTALLEAESISRTQAISQKGGKEIRYGTKSLLLPAMEKTR